MKKFVDIDSDDYLDSLDEYERELESDFEKEKPIENEKEEIAKITAMAARYLSRKKSVTLRLKEPDLEIMKIKASKLGIPYQTYINMVIHKDAQVF